VRTPESQGTAPISSKPPPRVGAQEITTNAPNGRIALEARSIGPSGSANMGRTMLEWSAER